MDNIIGIINSTRRSKGISIAKLSSACNIPQGTLTKILTGSTKSIKSHYKDALCHYLGIMPTTQHTTQQDRFGYVTVASSNINIQLASPMDNARTIVDKIIHLHSKGVNMVCMQELGVTGYCCGDLLYQPVLHHGAINALQYILDNTATYDILFTIGMPLMVNNRLYNCAVTIHQGTLLAITPKAHLPNYNEFAEKRHFQTAPDSTTTITLLDQQVAFGTDIIIVNKFNPTVRLAIEICEDIWVSIPPSSRHTDNGANIVFNLSTSNERVGKADYRHNLVATQSARCICGYVYCSSGQGESTGETVFGGHNIIAENGHILSENKLFTYKDCITELDTQYLDSERTKLHNFATKNDNYTTVYYNSNIATKTKLVREYKQYPFLATKQRYESILEMQSHALAHRIQHLDCNKLLLGVSGGLDSSLALLVCSRAMKILGRSNIDIIAISMPCFGTSTRTKDNSIRLPTLLQCDTKMIDITNSVTTHLEEIGHDVKDMDTTYENAQARQRTQVLMNLANANKGIVIGTGDMSEIALGWSTYNGDHMSMYNVNSGVPKTLVKALVEYEAQRLGGDIATTLTDILLTPVSPELLPTVDNKISQVTEDIIGPYVLHDYYLYAMLRQYQSPSKILYTATQTFVGMYDQATIYKWLRVFIIRFFTQQFKRTCSPGGVKIGRVSLSPRSDWNMASDTHYTLWLDELDSYYNEISQ